MSLIFVQGDDAPDINATLVIEDTLDPVDLTGAAVRFQMRKADDRRFTVNADATIEDENAGTVSYRWAANDLSVPGEYQAQWEITFQDTRVQTTVSAQTLTVRRQ